MSATLGNRRNDSRDAASGRALRWGAGVVVAVCAVVAFWPAVDAGFVNWDDPGTVTENPNVLGLTADAVRWAFSTFHMGHYQPLSWLSLCLDYDLWGGAARGFHLTNLLLHALNALLVYLIALRVIGLRQESVTKAGAGCDTAGVAGALLAALLFAVHPLRVESVAWVTERRDVLSSAFNLLTVHLYLRGQCIELGARRRRHLIGAVVVFALGLLAKASGVTMVAVLVILDVYPLRRLGGERGWFSAAVRRVWMEKIPFALPAIAAGIVAPMAQRAAGALAPWSGHGILERSAVSMYGLVFYVWKTVWPIALSPLYELPRPVRPTEMRFVVSAVFVAAAIAVMIVLWRRRRPMGLSVVAAGLIYAAVLWPVLGWFQSGPHLVGDRYSYLSCIAWVILVGAGFAALWRSVSTGAARVGLSIVGAGVVVVLGTMSWRYTQVWQTSETLWRAALRSETSCAICRENLAAAIAGDGHIDEAIVLYREAVALQPRLDQSHYGLARLLVERGERAEALEHVLESIRLEPGYAEAHFDLGMLRVEGGEIEPAMGAFRRAIEIDGEHVGARTNLGILLARVGRIEEAVEQFRRAVSISPRSGAARVNLAEILVSQGACAEAIGLLEEGLHLRPEAAILNESLERVRRRCAESGSGP